MSSLPVMPGLSVIIITKNEAENISACIESVIWADEIIVVDSGSDDATIEICQALGVQVFSHDWPGFGMQKNRALGYASQDWILSLDADECIPAELRTEIQSAIQNAHAEAYEIPRLSSFCGRYMHHSGWRPDYVTRLFKRGAGRFTDDLVHERVVIKGVTARLRHSILHQSFRNLEELLDKLNRYSTASACMLHDKKKSASLTTAVTHAVWAFLRTYVLRAGFLDGREGFMLAVATAEGSYYRYVKLMLMAQKK